MGYILAIIAIPLALAELALIILFMLTQFGQHVEEYEVVGFQKKKFLGRVLPIIERENDEGETEKINVKQIDQISYLLSPAIERQIISVTGADTKSPTVPGYLKLVTGVLLLLPGLATVGLTMDKAYFTGQVMYITLLIAVLLGGWIALKLIQRL
ncbi:MAG: hypothetical protein JKY71_10355 [Alphaproteobacteria bacterium]|nr:hypothetical protein [Alphaproteobacteria bacterium]